MGTRSRRFSRLVGQLFHLPRTGRKVKHPRGAPVLRQTLTLAPLDDRAMPGSILGVVPQLTPWSELSSLPALPVHPGVTPPTVSGSTDPVLMSILTAAPSPPPTPPTSPTGDDGPRRVALNDVLGGLQAPQTPALYWSAPGGTTGGTGFWPAGGGSPPSISFHGLNESSFAAAPFSTFSGATLDSLTTFAPSFSGNRSYNLSDSSNVTTTGTDPGGIGYTTVTHHDFTLTITATTNAGGWTYQEQFTDTFDAITTPAYLGGAAAHQHGQSGYTLNASETPSTRSFTLDSFLTSVESGAREDIVSGTDGSRDVVFAWTTVRQYGRTVTSTTDRTTGAIAGTDSADGGWQTGYSGTGTYTRSGSTSGESLSLSGTTGDHGGAWGAFGYSTSATRSASGAVGLSGSGWDATGQSTTDWYAGSGAYHTWYGTPYSAGMTSGSGGQTDGTVAESGTATTTQSLTRWQTLNGAGQWVPTGGSGGGTYTGRDDWSYAGTGTYWAVSASGNLVSGTTGESGYTHTAYDLPYTATLVTPGSGGAYWSFASGAQPGSTGSGAGDWSWYSGSGPYQTTSGTAYSATAPSGSGGTTSGTIGESGSTGAGYSDTVYYAIGASGSWSATSGNGSEFNSGSNDWSYSGTGTYWYADGSGARASGTTAESGYTHEDWNLPASASLSPGGSGGGTWSYTGAGQTATSASAGGDWWSYSGAGSYQGSYGTPYSATGTGSGGAVSGTIAEGGSAASGYSDTVYESITASGTWKASGGVGSGFDSGHDDWSYSGTGTYWYADASSRASGTTTASGYTHDDWNYPYSASLNTQASADPYWTFTGNGQSGASGGDWSSYSGAGTYQNSYGSAYSAGAVGSGGTVSGTMTESGSDANGYTYTTNESIGALDGTWHATGGTGTGFDTGRDDQSYSGSGTYWSNDGSGNVASGTTSESGFVHDDWNLPNTAALTVPGAGSPYWTYAGTGAASESAGDWSSYSGTGSFQGSVGSPYSATAVLGSGAAVSGTAQASGSAGSGYSRTVNAAISTDGTWNATGGTGTTFNSGRDDWSYSGNGTYWYADGSGAHVSGTLGESGYTHDDWNLPASVSLTVPASGSPYWTASGTGQVNASGGDWTQYSGAGTYQWSGAGGSGVPASGGGGTVSGTIAESGSAGAGYTDTVTEAISGTGLWHITGGTGTAFDNGRNDWSYSGSGTYSFNDGSAMQISGTIQESGYTHNDWDLPYSGVLQPDPVTSGAWVWVKSGTGQTKASAGDWTSYSGSGTYQWSTGTTYTSGATNGSGTTMSGTIQESGSAGAGYSETVNQAIGASGYWAPTGGTATEFNSGRDDMSYAGAGTYWFGDAGWVVTGTAGESGSAHDDWNLPDTATLNIPGGSWTYTGTGQVNASADDSSWYNGTGTFTDGIITGSLSDSGSAASHASATAGYTISASGVWNQTSGTGATSGHSERHGFYSGTGTRTTSSTSTGGSLTSSWSLTDTQRESGHKDWTQDYDTHSAFTSGAWHTSGSATTAESGDGLRSYSVSGVSDQTYNYSSTYPGGGNTSNWTQHASMSGSGSADWSYQFRTSAALSSNGVVSTMTTTAASGHSNWDYTASASGSMATTSNYSSGGTTSYSESSGSFNATDHEYGSAQWSESYTRVTAPYSGSGSGSGSGGGMSTTVTGGASGTIDAHGDATYDGHTSGYTDTTATSTGYYRHDHYTWSSGTTSDDHYDYHNAWSTAGSMSGSGMSGSGSSHQWGHKTDTWSSSWSWTETHTGSGSGSGSGSGWTSSGGYSGGSTTPSSYDTSGWGANYYPGGYWWGNVGMSGGYNGPGGLGWSWYGGGWGYGGTGWSAAGPRPRFGRGPGPYGSTAGPDSPYVFPAGTNLPGTSDGVGDGNQTALSQLTNLTSPSPQMSRPLSDTEAKPGDAPAPKAAKPKLDLDKAIEKFNKFEDAKKLLEDAAKNQGVKKIEIKLFDPGTREGNYEGYWDPKNNTIWVRSDLDLDIAVSTILFEALRAKMWKEQADFLKDAAAGKYGRDEYAKKKEEYGYKVTQQHHEIAEKAVKKGVWDPKTDEYKDGWKSFEDFLKHADTPPKGKGADDSHTGFFRKQWDKSYKKAWEEAQKKK